MARNKNKARKKKKTVVLEEAQAAVLKGETPHVNGSTTLGAKAVVDPFDGKMRIKVISLRNDPLGHMYARECIDDVQLRAGRDYQRDWEVAEIGGVRAIDPAKDKVDGGKFTEPDTDSRLKARAELNRLHAALGEYGRQLVQLVLAQNIALAQVAQMWGMLEHHAYRSLRFRFIECLDTIARKKGHALERADGGPRRKRDEFDIMARYAGNPGLHRAIRRARGA